MPRYRVTLAYDGTGFVGWQRQDSGTSIQGLLEYALFPFEERRIAVIGAGRTDAGVHALGQVAAFTLERSIEPPTLIRAINARLPPSVRVIDAADAPASFHPRFDAVAKTYRYRLFTGAVLSPFDHRYAWHVPGALDVGAMGVAAAVLAGRHDFAAFESAGSDVGSTERELFDSRIECGSEDPRHKPEDGVAPVFRPATIEGGVAPVFRPATIEDGVAPVFRPATIEDGVAPVFRPATIEYIVRGDGFLRHMVRAIVGTLVEIGRGRRPAEWMRAVLESRDRNAAGPTAPAEGLCLVSVEYGVRPSH